MTWRPIAALTSIAAGEGTMDEVLRLAAEGRATVPADATSNTVITMTTTACADERRQSLRSWTRKRVPWMAG
ncbi:hypothetical protein [Rhizobium sp. Nf11,1]|uniref:hypothetical protein n=1 Tax=unclassified Rhizobium TaxID=2613769 RepID=UPI003D345026